MTTRVFIVTHTREISPDREDFKLIGVYSSKQAATAAVGRIKTLPGFSDTPEGFHVQAYALNKDHWTEGFSTVGLPDPDRRQTDEGADPRRQQKTLKRKRSRR